MYIVEIQESGYEGIDGKLIREELGVRSGGAAHQNYRAPRNLYISGIILPTFIISSVSSQAYWG
jgi:hypothetical protein